MAVVFSGEKAITMILIPPVQGSVESAAAAAALKSWDFSSRASSDVLRFGEMRDHIKTLEKDAVFFRGQLAVARSKEKTAVDAEAFILECLDTTSRDLAGKIFPSCFLEFLPVLKLSSCHVFTSAVCSFCIRSSQGEKTPRRPLECSSNLRIITCWKLLE